MTAPFCGFEPCVSVSPQLSQTNFAQVCPGGSPSSCGTLGLAGTYPPVACRTIFKEVDWNSGALAHLFLRSASCPGFSWGQNLTNATTGGTVTWSYMAGSDVLYLDAKSLSLMFPGLGLSINNGSGPVTYNVIGVFPDLGYVTVNGTLQGTAGTVYSCSSSCTIGQAAFAWTAY